jgi:hypothetical protein
MSAFVGTADMTSSLNGERKKRNLLQLWRRLTGELDLQRGASTALA